MKKTLKLTSVLLALLLLIVSCSPEKQMDGKTAETKKQMTETEYSQNREAIRGVSVVEAYAVANSENATPSSRAVAGGAFTLTFSENTNISSSDILSKLEGKASKATSDTEEAFYTTLSKSIPPSMKLEIVNGSFVNYKTQDGIRVVSSLDVTIIIGDKTIEIEKDADEKWIEIDGTFFDNTQLEKMLDAAEDAAEAIEEIFKNLENIKIENKIIDLKTLLNGNEQKFSLEIKEGETLETKIEGTTIFKITDDKKLSTSFDFKYTEYEDDGKTIDEEFNLNASLLLNINPASIGDITLTLIENATVTINGMEVWADSFLDELASF